MKIRPSTDSRTIGLNRTTVFYDGGCPLCRREISHYKKLDRDRNISWVDITTEPATLDNFGLNSRAAMSRFHVLDTRGRWQTGAWGFAEVWSELPGYRWVEKIVRVSRTLPLLDRLYSKFARWRYRRRCLDNCFTVPGTRP